jgi:hypothetical protein
LEPPVHSDIIPAAMPVRLNAMTSFFRLLSVSMALLFAASNCGGGKASRLPKLEIDPSETDAEIDSSYPLTVRNTGDKELTLTARPVLLNVKGCEGEDTAITNPFTLTLPEGLAFPVQISPQSGVTVAGMPSQVVLTVAYTPIPTPKECQREASLTIHSNDPNHPTLVVNLRVVRAEPNIEADPPVVDLGFVLEGKGTEGVVNLLNTGLGDLFLSKITFVGQLGFSMQWRCDLVDGGTSEEWTAIGDVAQTIGSDLCKPILIPRNEVFQVPVKYQASSPDKAEATLIVESNDPDYKAGEGLEVLVHANWGGPRLCVIPTPIDLGSVVVPTGFGSMEVVLESCGDEEVQVSAVGFSDDTHKDFQLDAQPLGQISASTPLKLAPGQKSKAFYVKCVPESLNLDQDGKLVVDTGTLVVQNSSPTELVKVPMSCLPSKLECVECNFEVRAGSKKGEILQDGASIIPQQKLYFKDTSYDKSTVNNGIASRKWTPTQPEDSVSVFLPNDVASEVIFQPNIVGDYVITLDVENRQGCADTCSFNVKVEPPEGCHVELTWSTPGDPDQTDECLGCGSDVDLHVVHPLATGNMQDPSGETYGYCDPLYDCNWMMPHPVWDVVHASDPKHQPNLDRDDQEGAGPENFTYSVPETDKCYRIGVFYYNDKGFGNSYPTVRVYINSSTPVYERTATKGFGMSSMWDVGEVCCTDVAQPFIEFKQDNGDPVIVKNYKDCI